MAKGAITFLASFPPIQSAIKVGSDGMRVQLDVPESEMVSAIGLIALRDAVLRVTVEVSDTKPQIVRKVAPESSRDFTLVDARKKAHDGKAMGKQVPDGA